MAGRMLAVPVLVATMLLSTIPIGRPILAISLILLLLYNIGIDKTPIMNTRDYSCKIHYTDPQCRGIADERGVYYRTCGLLNVWRSGEPQVPLVKQGKTIRRFAKSYYISPCIGFVGYYAGPRTYIIDPLALADPLLACIDCPDDIEWRIGHFQRSLPLGYIESIKGDSNLIIDNDIRTLYDAIRTITRAPLFSFERFREICKLNLGVYSGDVYRCGYAVDTDNHLEELILYDTTFVYNDSSCQLACFQPGDLNGDRCLNAKDLSSLKLLFFGFDPHIALATTIGSFTYYPAADVNCDGRISIADLKLLQNYLRGIVDPPAYYADAPVE